MIKLIAILFLSLICLTTLPGKMQLQDSSYELATESEEQEKENKKGKKELKEYTAHKYPPACFISNLSGCYKEHQALQFPYPELDQPTPPPNSRL